MVGEPKVNLAFGLTDRDFTGDGLAKTVGTAETAGGTLTSFNRSNSVTSDEATAGVASWATIVLMEVGRVVCGVLIEVGLVFGIEVGLVFGAVTPEVILK